MHLVYQDAQSASVAGHRQHGHAIASVESAEWFKSKDAFMALILKSFERLYDEMKLGQAPVADKTDAS